MADRRGRISIPAGGARYAVGSVRIGLGRYGKVSTTAPEEAAGWDEGWNDNESDDGWGSDNSGKGAAGTGWEEGAGEKADAADGWGLEDEEAPQPAKERRVPTTPLNVESGSEGSGDEWGKF